jgi:hypothetical protein
MRETVPQMAPPPPATSGRQRASSRHSDALQTNRKRTTMNQITRRIRRKRSASSSSSLDALIKQYPELRPACRQKGQFQPRIDPAPGAERKPSRTGAERQFAQMLDKLAMQWRYEPFCLAIGVKATGTVRSFQPDFWLPELGLIVEICAQAPAKNQKIRLTSRGWPRLAVLVVTDEQVERLAKSSPTRWQLAEAFAQLLAEQGERVAREGDNPRRRRKVQVAAPAPARAASRRRGRRGGRRRSASAQAA